MSKNNYHHINPASPAVKELESVGVDLVIEIIDMFRSEFEENCNRIMSPIQKNDFTLIFRHSHSIRRNFEIFLDPDHPAMQLIYALETSARAKSYEHQKNDFVENDVDFKKLFAEIKDLLKEPLEEIKALGEEYKNGTCP